MHYAGGHKDIGNVIAIDIRFTPEEFSQIFGLNDPKDVNKIDVIKGNFKLICCKPMSEQ